MVRSESLVALPCGPAVSAKSGKPSRFKSYLPIPLYVSPARPARKTISPVTCARSYNPTGKRLSTDTRLITSTTALICGKPFPATTRRNSASAEPRYRDGSFPRDLYAMRVASTGGDASTPRGKANFWISFSRAFISSSSGAGDAPAVTCAVTHPNAVRGHFVFNFGSIVTFIAASACNRFQPSREVPQEFRLVDYFVAPDLPPFAPNVQNHFHDVLDVALCVRPPRNRQPHQIHFRVLAEHQGSNLHGANPAFQVKLVRQRHSRKLRRRNMRQECPGINVDCMSAWRLHDGHAFTRDVITEKRRRCNPVFQILLLQRFV